MTAAEAFSGEEPAHTNTAHFTNGYSFVQAFG